MQSEDKRIVRKEYSPRKAHAMASYLAAALFAALCLIAGRAFRPLYSDIDNFTISLVTNGLFDADTYVLYLHPLLCRVIGLLAGLFPFADWFAVLTHLLIFGEFLLLGQMALANVRTLIGRALCFALLLFHATAINVYTANYTVQAASFAATGMILLLSSAAKPAPAGRIGAGSLYVCAGFMWRMESALLFLPFFLLELAARRWDDPSLCWRDYLKSILRRLGICIIALALLAVSRYAVQSSPRYADSVRYDRARQAVQDYPQLKWETIAGDVAPVDEATYDQVRSWMQFDTVKVSLEALERIAASSVTTAYPLSLSGVGSALRSTISFMVSNSNPHAQILFAAWILLHLGLLFSRVPLHRKAQSLLAVLGVCVIMGYFTLQGRAPLRIWIPVVWASECGCLLSCAQARPAKSPALKAFGLAAILVLAFGVCSGLQSGSYVRPQSALTSRMDADEAVFEETKQDDALYIWQTWYGRVTQHYFEQGKLPSKAFIAHNIPAGGWTYGQVCFDNLLSRVHAENPAGALLTRENTYWVAADYEPALRFLSGEDSPAPAVRQAGTIAGIPVWSFSSNAQD